MSAIRWQVLPWPQWRTHWKVLHAWPPGAQWLLLSLMSVSFTVLGSVWWSADAWQSWWQAEEELQRLDEEVISLQQQASGLRLRIKELTATPHPSGGSLPAWQTWSQLPLPDDAHVLQQWLAWGRQHGLATQAMPLTGTHSVKYSGSLPALLAAVYGVPPQFAELRLTGFDWQRRHDGEHLLAKTATQTHLQLELSWSRTQQVALPVLSAKSTPDKDKSVPSGGTQTPAIAAPPPMTNARALYNPFAVTALRSGLPKHINEQVPKGWPLLHSTDLSQLRWVGTLYRTGERQSLLAFNGLVYPVHVGDRLGRDWGEVVDIAADHVVLREWHADAQGEWGAVNKRLPAGAKP